MTKGQPHNHRDSAAMASSPERKRFSFIDGLRGLAALSLVIYHAAVAGPVTELLAALPRWVAWSIEHSAGIRVAVFFVLSGFVIAYSLDGKAVTMHMVGRFALRRSLRLDPPYWAAIALTIAFSATASAFVKDHA